MEFLNLQWLPESIKKCSIKYLLNRYLGHFFSEELDLAQLNVDIFKGQGSINNIPLNLNTINEEISKYFAFNLTDGFVNRIELSVPWKSLWTDSCMFCLRDVQLTFCKVNKCPPFDPNHASSILSKSLTTSSMEIAEEIVNQDPDKFEGLEKFAELINSVIRRFKIFAHNTVIKFVLPQKRGTGHEIELRIGYLICEEEEINLDSQDAGGEKANSLLSEVVTKRITIDGIEVLINDVQITKLDGKHTFKIRFDDDHIDMEAFFASYIMAILNVEQLVILREFLTILSGNPSLADNMLAKERLMTSQDYRRVREIIQTESKSKYRNSSMTSSRLSQNGSNWTSDFADDDATFMSFNAHTAIEHEKNDSSPAFNCNVRIPGVILCLITNDTHNLCQFTNMPLFDARQSFIGFNSFLNEILHDYNHIRFLASNLCLNVSPNVVNFSCKNVSMYEYHDAKLNNILTVKDNVSDIILPSVRVKIANNNINLQLASTSIKVDFTLIEWHSKLLTLFDSSTTVATGQLRKSTQSELCLNIDCDNVDLELYFPIPDLRPTRNDYSRLHDEVLLMQVHGLALRIEASDVELMCNEVNIELKVDQSVKKIFNAQSENKDIKLHFSADSPSNVTELIDESVLLNQATSMHESINILQSSTISHQKDTDPFQVKRKMFGDESTEQILTPGDHDHLERYLNHNRNCTKNLLCISVPYGNVYLENKQIFELIYNRFVNDLILWTPYFKQSSASTASPPMDCDPHVDPFKQPAPELVFPVYDEMLSSESYPQPPPPLLSTVSQTATFFSCKEMTESSDSMVSDASFHSVAGQSSEPANALNEFVLRMEIADLKLDFYTESRQQNTLYATNLLLGIVVGPLKNNSTVVSLCSENVKYHLENRPILIGNTFLDGNCILNLSIDIRREMEMLKKIKMAVQLNHALLLGLELPIFEQLFEFVNVVDDEILGYVCPKVVLELHGDIVQSGISFDNLKERPTLLQCEEVYLTSMVIENTNQTILRFFIEEALLCFKRNNMCHDLLKNYVAVINSGVIDLNVKISKDGRIELKLSNNVINVRGCPDSMVTLCQFFQTFVGEESAEADGDDSNDVHTSQKNQNGSELIADALNECSDSSSSKADQKSCKCEAPKLDDSTFLILGEDDFGTGINFSQEPQVRVLVDEPIKIIENYFKFTNYTVIPEVNASTLARYLLDRMSLRFSIFDGKDFDDVYCDEDEIQSKKLDIISQANLSMRSVKSSLSKAHSGRQDSKGVRFMQNSVVWENIDLVSNNGYIMNNSPSESHYALRSIGGVNRKTDISVVFVLNKIKVLFEKFDKDCDLAWRFYFFVEEIEILDQVSTSKIKKILYEYFSETMPRRKHSNMFSIHLNCHRNFQDMNEESDLKVSMKPLRVNIDQDTLMFIIQFLTTVGEILNPKASATDEMGSNSNLKKTNSDSKSSFNDDDDGSMDFDDDNESCSSKAYSTSPPDSEYGRPRCESTGSANTGGSFDNIFVKSFVFAPDVPIRLDYHGRHIDLKNVSHL